MSFTKQISWPSGDDKIVTTTSAFPSVFKVIGGFIIYDPLCSKTVLTSASAHENAILPKAYPLSIGNFYVYKITNSK